ncbi:MAG TPA: hypothetical protein VHS03_05580 [Gaiellaceae bacterium]|nr:hypothetical protein [Gaiellaceae bacterium]
MNIRAPGGEERWVEAGRPIVPSLLVDGVASPILHVAQLASMLGLEAPPSLEAARLAWDSVAVLDAWVKLITPLDFAALTAPTPSRGRSLRNLTVNVFHPFELLPGAFESGRFDWDPELDDEREAALVDAAAVVGYARVRHDAWRDWVFEHETELAERDPQVSSPRGEVAYSTLLDFQRWHAAFHYRQLLAVLGTAGALSLASLADLDLPAAVF